MKIIRIAIAAVVAAASVIFAVPSASAAADVPAAIPVQYVSEYFWGTSGDNRSGQTSGTVACPAGKTVVSSGASVTDYYGGSRSLSSIFPNADFTAATAQGRLGIGGYLQLTVGCAPTAQMTEVTSNVVNIAGEARFKRGVVYCPAGMRAFGGGGFIVRQYFGIPSFDSYGMTSNAVSADGTGWTFAASTHTATDRLIIRTRCAPLRGSYVDSTSVPAGYSPGQTYWACTFGGTPLSGGVYLSKPNGNEVRTGQVTHSVPASGNRWYANGYSFDDYYHPDKLVVLIQCIR